MIMVLVEETYAGDGEGQDLILTCTNTMIFR